MFAQTTLCHLKAQYFFLGAEGQGFLGFVVGLGIEGAQLVGGEAWPAGHQEPAGGLVSALDGCFAVICLRG